MHSYMNMWMLWELFVDSPLLSHCLTIVEFRRLFDLSKHLFTYCTVLHAIIVSALHQFFERHHNVGNLRTHDPTIRQTNQIGYNRHTWRNRKWSNRQRYGGNYANAYSQIGLRRRRQQLLDELMNILIIVLLNMSQSDMLFMCIFVIYALLII